MSGDPKLNHLDDLALLRRVLGEYVQGNQIVDGHWYSPERGSTPDLPPAADVLAWIHSHDHGEVAYPTDHTYRVIVEATLAAIAALSLPPDEDSLPHFINQPATPDELALIETLRTEAGQ